MIYTRDYLYGILAFGYTFLYFSSAGAYASLDTFRRSLMCIQREFEDQSIVNGIGSRKSTKTVIVV